MSNEKVFYVLWYYCHFMRCLYHVIPERLLCCVPWALTSGELQLKQLMMIQVCTSFSSHLRVHACQSRHYCLGCCISACKLKWSKCVYQVFRPLLLTCVLMHAQTLIQSRLYYLGCCISACKLKQLMKIQVRIPVFRPLLLTHVQPLKCCHQKRQHCWPYSAALVYVNLYWFT